MFIQTMAGDALSTAAAFALAASLAACGASPEAASDSSPGARIMVKLVRHSGDSAAIAAEATRIAGVPVTYAAATSPAWHALSLHCATPSGCEAAIARMRAAPAVYETVEADHRKTRVAS